jgi:Lrp/AsnC family transcriptional regulator, leucine-responsive regulatory protein
MRRGHGRLLLQRWIDDGKLYRNALDVIAIWSAAAMLEARSCESEEDFVQKVADEMDRRILKELAGDARLANNELAERVGLSASACLRRLRRLEEAEIIQGYTALIDPAVNGWTMTALASIRLSRQHEDEIQMFENAVREWDEVLECHLVTGSRDYVLKVMSSGLDDYERFIKEKIARLKCVDTIETSFVMNTIKARRI